MPIRLSMIRQAQSINLSKKEEWNDLNEIDPIVHQIDDTFYIMYTYSHY